VKTLNELPMPAVYANPVVRKRLIEFLGGDTVGAAWMGALVGELYGNA
jgi:hypothetical protein